MEATGGNGTVRTPDERTIKRLLDWRPALGVLSVYVSIDPGERREPWRVDLRQKLDSLVEGEADNDRRATLAATAERIRRRFPEQSPPSGRCQIGFCEVAPKSGRDLWMAAQISRGVTQVFDRDRPYLTPLLELLDDGAPVGVLAVSAERVRLHEWALGELADLDVWEAVVFMPNWRERKAPSSPDPARVQGASSSGHDQFDQRLDANRQRFLEQVGGLVAERAERRRWRRVLAFGDARQVDEVRQGARHHVDIELADEANVISESDHGRLLERVEQAVEAGNRRRELELVKAALDAAHASAGRGAIGINEIERSLTEGRVRHLLVDAEDPTPDLSQVEDHLVEQALRTSAEVTPVEGEAAEVLREHGGVAALLRY
ncbi:MAG TPA: VLRF1 family aeRF1-type release factor [Solirubrobacterales bacterium]|nr:VLRF1 family aeRF1-type release factor [Solirubrobacterales bacterium]